MKENFKPVNGIEVLEKLATIPTHTWNYKSEGIEVQHIGPTAQDFYATYGLGNNDKSISTVDADGISFAAIQGLYGITQEQSETIENLLVENAKLEARLSALELKSQTSPKSISLLPWMVSIGLGLVLLLEGNLKKRSTKSVHPDL